MADMDVRGAVRLTVIMGVSGALLTGITASNSLGAQSRETILTEAVRDIDRNGVPDTAAIVMLDGRRFSIEGSGVAADEALSATMTPSRKKISRRL